jgi:uncharacterized repeat protein (TIGR03803 family)
MNGYPSTTVEQIGTDSNCVDGAPKHSPWYEFYSPNGQPQQTLSLAVNAGDQVSAEVSYRDGIFTLTITDVTTGQSAPPETSPFSPALRSSAEWIAEDPSSISGILPFANFGLVSFGVDYTGVANTCTATVGAQTGVIGSFPFTAWAILNGPNVATPSPLSSDGSSFQVTTQPFSLLLSLNSGAGPNGTLVQGLDGNLYGTTSYGGANRLGTVLGITTGGTPTALYSFSGIDGANPVGGLTLANSGNFYGTTSGGEGSDGSPRWVYSHHSTYSGTTTARSSKSLRLALRRRYTAFAAPQTVCARTATFLTRR